MGIALATQERATGVLTLTFDEIYEQYGTRIARYLHRRLGLDGGEEATAEVFARAYAAFDRYEPRGASPLPWLFGIAANVVADQRRRERRRLAALERLASREPQLAEGQDGTRVDADLVRALQRLRAGEREALLLLAWGELSYDEIAVALGVPVGTVKSRIARARREIAPSVRPGKDGTR